MCKWDRTAETYLTDDGAVCKRDDYGDPTRHCSARRTCSNHVGAKELSCARCLGRTRTDLRQIVELATLLPIEALTDGVDSQAADLAGPAADVEAWSWRKVAAKQGVAWHVSLVEDDDDWHPYTVLTRWEWMIREDYEHPTSARTDVGRAGAYLERHLHRVAQDDGRDFPLLARELRKCRQHLENVLHDSQSKERGAPCPTCRPDGAVVRLEHEFGHWCTDEACERMHYASDEADRWVCPRNREHVWTEKAYRDYIEERTA